MDPAPGAPAYICDCMASFDDCDGNSGNGALSSVSIQSICQSANMARDTGPAWAVSSQLSAQRRQQVGPGSASVCMCARVLALPSCPQAARPPC